MTEGTMPRRLLLVDDHTIVREGLKRILDGSGDGWIIAEAGSGFQALEILRQSAFALAIVDLSLAVELDHFNAAGELQAAAGPITRRVVRDINCQSASRMGMQTSPITAKNGTVHVRHRTDWGSATARCWGRSA